MKIAVINFSGNVGKSTIARHLLAPRMPGSEVISIESINAGDDERSALRGRQFAHLQDYLNSVNHDVIVDIGASNVEDLLALMADYEGSHESFDYFVVPTVPELKQQQDTIATLVELARLGVPAGRIRVVFNHLERGSDVEEVFHVVLAFLKTTPIARASLRCALRVNDIYKRAKGLNASIAELAADPTDYLAMLSTAANAADRLASAQRMACRQLAKGVLPKLDECFAALELERATAVGTTCRSAP